MIEPIPPLPVPIATPSPQTVSLHEAADHPATSTDNNRQQARGRRHSNSESSEDSYHPPTTRQRNISNNNPPQVAQVPAEDHSKVKQLLKRYAPRLKFTANKYETDMYRYFTAQSATEEELIFNFYADIKDSLTLAYQAESQISYQRWYETMFASRANI